MSRFSRALGLLAVPLTISGLLAAPSSAHEGRDKDPDPLITEQEEPRCGPGQRDLARAGDRFAQGCLSQDQVERLGGNEGELGVGEQAARNMQLLANIPKNGAFADYGAFSSDLAFQGDYAFAGNYNGFTVYDISTPSAPEQVAQVVCPGAQNDISVHGDLLVLSTDSSRSDDSCASSGQSATIKESWEGIKVFDISDPVNPAYVSAVETPCGSHTHTLAPDRVGENLFVYVSSYFPNASFPDCQPPHDLISVVRIPVRSPGEAVLDGTPTLFPEGGNPSGNYSRETSGCHDITAYPSKDIAAGACMGDGVLLDISDRSHPVVTEQVRDTENFAFWHSATFNDRGTKVVFTDELGGGGAPTCNDTVGDTKGANGIYDIVGGQLEFASYWKMPRPQADTENCVAHNGSMIPVKGRDIMVQAWYQGGISVYEFTDSTNPRELAWFDRGPLSETSLMLGGSWSAYFYNGYVYSNDIQKGFDVLKITERSLKNTVTGGYEEFNPQSQPSFNG